MIITILGLYIPLIRNSTLLRFLFGMTSNHRFARLFDRRLPLLVVHLFYIGLFILSIVNHTPAVTPMPSTYDAGKDVVLGAESIVDRSASGVDIVDDPSAAAGKAIVFSAGARQHATPDPSVFIEMRFSALAVTAPDRPDLVEPTSDQGSEYK